MVSVSAPKGIEKRVVGFGILKSGLISLYHELRQDDSSLSKQLTKGVYNYKTADSELGIKEDTLENIAKTHGLDTEFRKYVQSDIVGGLRFKISWLYHAVTSIKDGLEDIVEGVEAGATAAAAPETAGIGALAVQLMGADFEIPLYLVTQTAYSVLAAVLGYTSGTYTLTRRGLTDYATDMAKGYIGAAINIIPVLGIMVEWGTNLDDKVPRMIETSSRRTKIWLLNQIRKKKGMQLLEEEPDVISEFGPRMLGLWEKSKTKFGDFKEKMVDYSTRFKDTIPYGSDFARKPVYATV